MNFGENHIWTENNKKKPQNPESLVQRVSGDFCVSTQTELC